MPTTTSSPLFDSLAAGLRSSAGRPTTPFAASATTRSVAPGTAPTWMTSATVATATTAPRIRREVQTSLPSVASIVSDPIPAHDLTAEERDIIASMGGTVARLLLEMMNDGRPRR